MRWMVTTLIFALIFLAGSPGAGWAASTADAQRALDKVKSRMEQGRDRYAITLLQRFLRDYPEDARRDEVYMLLAVASVRVRKNRQAAEWLQKLVADFPQSEHAAQAKQVLRDIELTEAQKDSSVSVNKRKRNTVTARGNKGNQAGFNRWMKKNQSASRSQTPRRVASKREPITLEGLPDTGDVETLISQVQIEGEGENYKVTAADVTFFLAHEDRLADIAVHHFKQVAPALISEGKRFISAAYKFEVISKGPVSGTMATTRIRHGAAADSTWEIKHRESALRRLKSAPVNQIYQPLFQQTREQLIAQIEGRDAPQLPNALYPAFAQSPWAKQVTIDPGDPRMLPVRYGYTAARFYVYNGAYDPQRGKVLQSVLPFPFAAPESVEALNRQANEHLAQRRDLMLRGREIFKSAPKTPNGPRDRAFSRAYQVRYATEVFWPAQRETNASLVSILAAIPVTEEGLDFAMDMVTLIEQTSINRNWDHLSIWEEITGKIANCTFRYRHPVEPHSAEAIVDPVTQQSVCQIEKDEDYLLDAFRVGYALRAEALILDKLEREGLDANQPLLAFMFSPESQRVIESFLNRDPSQFLDSDRYCLTPDCSSDLYAHVQKQLGGATDPGSMLQRLAQLRDKTDTFLRQVNASGADNAGLRSEIASYARDNARPQMQSFVRYAERQLSRLSSTDLPAYERWETTLAQPVRWLIDDWIQLWNYGYRVSDKDRLLAAFYMPGGNMASNHSPYPGMGSGLVHAQASWLNMREANTLADPSLLRSDKIKTGTAYLPAPPEPAGMRLMTPTEIAFGNVGTQIGQIGGAGIAHAARLAELERLLQQARADFFSCNGACANSEKRLLFSDLLLKKDIHYLQLTGASGALLHEGQRNLSLIVEGATGQSGGTLIDDGIPPRCRGFFDRWVDKYRGEYGGSLKSEMEAGFAGLGLLATGNFAAVQQQGKAMLTKLGDTFANTSQEYGVYQVCRDQWEYDNQVR